MNQIPDTDWVYDIETYLDLFCVDITHVATRTRYIFEVSDRVNQSPQFIKFLCRLRDTGARMFGFNNEGFDWPVCQFVAHDSRGYFEAIDAHRKANAIIGAGFGPSRWDHNIWPSDRMVTQGDLYKIHHFDNAARSTSLKKIEIALRAPHVIDLPYPPDQPTTSAQKDEIIHYMTTGDVSNTLKFYHASLDQIRFRDDLAQKYPDMGDVLNMNDTKIGKKFFERELERNGTPCRVKVNGRNQPRQMIRDSVALRDVISPRVTFQHPEFQRVKTWLEGQVLGPKQDARAAPGEIETKGVFSDLSATIDGFTYDFGTGGIHGSLHSTVVREDDEWEIWDWDVASYYPNIAISNRLFPEHLSEKFCDIYEQVYQMRLTAGKKTTEGAMLKLALNGVYGDSNNKYSPFFDPQYTMGITINGQLMLCMLAEWLRFGIGATDLLNHPEEQYHLDQIHEGVQMIQINTDGLTVKVRKDCIEWMQHCCKQWENHTGLELESVRYKSMFIRDVNSYLAVKYDGGIKRIGAYAYETPLSDPASLKDDGTWAFQTKERGWHQDHSMLVIRKAAEAQMVHGVPVAEFIKGHRDKFDFMKSVKVPRSSRLLYGQDLTIQNNTRYYVSTSGSSLTKVMPPLKGKSDERRIGVDTGWTVTVVNDADKFRWDNVNWLYYINEAEKLLI